ncbi:peptidylprolyl isomerase [Edaphocola aurantiacus]|uniref:peptidylprolyl isomerase n=1 Tax=Edaphocola aurantiacus TaxID=2601682 RepID=UPI001C9506B8|nr:peptidylprolyl isomerase [Edaphocola aurantiacus]
MNKKYSVLLGISLGVTVMSAQAQTVFTVGKDAISKEEFLAGYKKNSSNNTLRYDYNSLNEFANLYALYKMKVKEAETLRMDTLAVLKNDINNYKTQLARNYLTSKDYVSVLTKEAYERSKTERKVAHILVQHYTADPTNDASKKFIDSLYNQINTGKASFEDIAKRYSMDKSTGNLGGSLGYITALQTPYEFENVAYSTPVGSMSKPFKTQYGYHIIKVLAERPTNGTVEVAQILLPTDNGTPDLVNEQLKLANEIRAKVIAKQATFENMVRQYSKDEYSVNNDGKLPAFKTGKMTENFENAAFGLKNPGDISEPFVTDYGIHLLKLISKKPLGTYAEEERELTSKIEQNSRFEIAKQKDMAEAKKRLGFKEFPENMAAMIATINQSDLEKGATLQEYPQLTAKLFEVQSKSYSQKDFLQYVKDLTMGRLNGRKEDAFRELYRIYTDKVITDILVDELEKNNKEYQGLVSEYRNGVLIFDLMDKNIWSKATKDTVGLRNFYKSNSSQYQWQPGFDGVIFQSKNHEALTQIHDALAQGLSVEDALAKVNTPTTSEKIYQQTGRFDFSSVSNFDKNQLKEGKVSDIKSDNNGETLIYPSKIYTTAMPKTLDEAKGSVVEDYQKQLEKNWETELRSKYSYKLNTDVLKKLVR